MVTSADVLPSWSGLPLNRVYLGCGGGGFKWVFDASVWNFGAADRTPDLSIEKRLDPPKLSIDFIYSDALFSMIKASSSSLTMSAMHGR